MTRQFPSNVQIPDIPPCLSGTKRKEYTIKVVTPMFGGGVTAGENDPDMLIRPTTIRGHLRFWWRVLYGAKYHSVTEMRKAESEIWGSTEKSSKVGICVNVVSKGKSEACADFPPGRNFPEFKRGYPGYVLFPFQGKKDRGAIVESPKEATSGIVFRLICRCPDDIAQQVESVIRAWVNFGGIGARTRRGCGALRVEELPIQTINGGYVLLNIAWKGFLSGCNGCMGQIGFCLSCFPSAT